MRNQSDVIDQIDIDGTKYPLKLDSEGTFHLELSEEEIVSGPLKKEVLERAKGIIRRRKKVKIPSTLMEESNWHHAGELKFIDVVVTGKHASQGSILYRRADGSAWSRGRYANDEHFLKPLTPELKARCTELYEGIAAAKTAYEDFLKDHTLDVHEALKAAGEKVGEK